MELRQTSKEYLVSKFIYQRLLLSPEEFSAMLEKFSEIKIFITGRILASPEPLSQESLVEEYRAYYDTLSTPEEKPLIAKIFTESEEAVYEQRLSVDRTLIKPCAPVVQFVEHRFVVTFDGRIEPMVYGKAAVRFGFQLALPTLFMDEGKPESVLAEKRYKNGELFRLLQRFFRDTTEPATFLVQGQKVITPLRIGKRCRREGYHDFKRAGIELL
ncbi:MAG: hypothetical protein JSR76_03250 [Verrucomicrobia bacterium]|nr:hypothetical protein [Verrucomicrobiota bacterium]